MKAPFLAGFLARDGVLVIRGLLERPQRMILGRVVLVGMEGKGETLNHWGLLVSWLVKHELVSGSPLARTPWVWPVPEALAGRVRSGGLFQETLQLGTCSPSIVFVVSMIVFFWHLVDRRVGGILQHLAKCFFPHILGGQGKGIACNGAVVL